MQLLLKRKQVMHTFKNKVRVTSDEGRGKPSCIGSHDSCGKYIKPSSLVTRRSSLKVTGVTLIEMVIFIVIVGVAVTGVTAVYINVSRSSAVPMVKMRSIELGQSMLEEILLKAYDESTPNGGGCVDFPAGSSRCVSGDTATSTTVADFGTDGETRSSFDDVDDYHNLAYCGANTTAADALCSGSCPRLLDDAETDIADEYAGYTICVRLSFAGAEMNSVAPGVGTTSVLAEDAKRIDVIVTDHLNGRVVLSAYRLNF